jgi:pyruvate dehydrogenase E1 component beta subunit
MTAKQGAPPDMNKRVETEKLTIAQAVRNALWQEMKADEQVLVLGEDVGVDGGVFRATDGLFEEFGRERVVDTPLAESGIVGTSIGLAIAGFRPVAEIQFMGFVYPALNQILAHASRMRNRTRGGLHVPLVIRMPYGGGIHAPEHHSESYESIFVNTPGLKVVIPSTPYDAKGLLIAAIRDNDPVIFMEPKLIYRAFREDVPVEPYTIPFGKAKILQPGSDVTLISYGAMVRVCLEAARALAEERTSVEIVDLRTLNPLDIDTVVESVSKTGRAVVVHEAPKTGGFGAELSAQISERAILQLLAPVERATGFDVTFPLSTLERHYMPTAARVVRAVRKTLEF